MRPALVVLTISQSKASRTRREGMDPNESRSIYSEWNTSPRKNLKYYQKYGTIRTSAKAPLRGNWLWQRHCLHLKSHLQTKLNRQVDLEAACQSSSVPERSLDLFRIGHYGRHSTSLSETGTRVLKSSVGTRCDHSGGSAFDHKRSQASSYIPLRADLLN